MARDRHHLSIRGELWRLLEEGARRRGFNKIVDYIAFLVNVDLASMDAPQDAAGQRWEYLYTVMRSGYLPYPVFRDLYITAERAGWGRDGFDAEKGFEACLSQAERYKVLDREAARRACMSIADLLLSRSINTLAWMGMSRCDRGFRVTVEADKTRLTARAKVECMDASNSRE